jgi:conjugal transfer pilus assembly protein TraD
MEQAPPLSLRVAGQHGVVLAARLRGESALPCAGRQVVISPARLTHHALVMGATGSGKTETLLRLAWVLAKRFDAQVLYLDGKGDRECAARFTALMADAGRETRVFPNQRFDGWRGEPHDIHSRLAEIVDYATDGPAAWYRDIARHVLSGVCSHPDGPPRSSAQALERMDLDGLRAVHGKAWAKGLRDDLVSQTRLRYQSFFTQTRGALDGGWSWDETRAAYCLLDTLALKDEAGGLARFLLEDFAQYFAIRKPRERFCVMIVDEFSSLTGAGSMASRLEQARGFNTALVLAPQTAAGLGEPAEADRILGSVETVVCHRVNTPDAVIELAGTRRVVEYSTQIDELVGPTGAGSARLQHTFKVDPNQVRALRPGEAFIINRGLAMKARIHRAPQITQALPPIEAPASTAAAKRPRGSKTSAKAPDGATTKAGGQPANPRKELPF